MGLLLVVLSELNIYFENMLILISNMIYINRYYIKKGCLGSSIIAKHNKASTNQKM